MTEITKLILKENLENFFTSDDLKRLMPSDNIRRCQVRRSLANGDFVKRGKGLYSLNEKLRNNPADRKAELDDEELKSVVELLLKKGAGEVFLFGSFLKGTASQVSDLDIGVKGLSGKDFFTTLAALDEVSRHQIDLVDFDRDKDFYEHLVRTGTVRKLA